MKNTSATFQLVRAIIFVIVVVGVSVLLAKFASKEPFLAWLGTLATMLGIILYAGSEVYIGDEKKKVWWACLIDKRNRVSLSRFQLIIWTLVVLSSYVTAVFVNFSNPANLDPLAVAVPPEMWVLMGISTASLLGTPLIHNSKEEASQNSSILDENAKVLEASWTDLIRGEEKGKAGYLDIGRIQMLFFTCTIVLAYCYAVGREFRSFEEAVTSLPAVPESMLALLGISHTAYLGGKAVVKTERGRDQDSDKEISGTQEETNEEQGEA